ncbi:MAG TPA: deoxyguanosinetriphosphate triphosphohydrolase [Cryomorphaceae bacterium]|nr:deoxyguanosinetriphosphate triphosphohydrolase [Owenweeksia sp.]HBF20037.1 deoxyguanosinetriphosphate triphosphohydrolase [Cryomorphaceae bacterium]|tara:strand:- start:1306 stop:2676 length:1371 start_codon:yes stop_codon:yes gene_type:complete
MEMTWLNCFTSNRFGMEKGTENVRSEYERDYDRIIFSSAFRRLQNKTQVFPLPEHVFVHNRLTHSLEVVSVGRSLGKIAGDALAEEPGIKADEVAHDFYRNQLKNVISTACLAHDLGNPAFGHSGEEAISQHFRDRVDDKAFRDLFTPAQWEDLTHFEGNANALRILTRQFNGRLKGGYRLTYPTLASILKYPCESTGRIHKGPKHRSKYGFFQSDKETFLDVVSTLHLKKEEDSPMAYFRHPFVYLVEAADDICYSIIDYEDAHRLGILSFAEVKEAFMGLLEKNPEEDLGRVSSNLDNLQNDPNEAVAYLRAKTINFLVTECAKVFIDNRQALLKGEFKGALIDHCESLQEPLKHIEQVSVARIYNHSSVVKIELAGFRIMSGLIEDLVEAALADEKEKRHKKLLNLMPVQYRYPEDASAYEKIMCILDYVSGMTDNYALELYRNLRGISVPEI